MSYTDALDRIDRRLVRIEEKIDDLTIQVVENRTNISNMKVIDMKMLTFITTLVYGLFEIAKAVLLKKV